MKAPLASATSLGDNILLITALCFHSVFEGIAIGVAETKADAWEALWTVCLHKIFAAVAMGIALLRMIPDRPLLSCVAYAFAFAISTVYWPGSCYHNQCLEMLVWQAGYGC